jgi:hypothetical protein
VSSSVREPFVIVLRGGLHGGPGARLRCACSDLMCRRQALGARPCPGARKREGGRPPHFQVRPPPSPPTRCHAQPPHPLRWLPDHILALLKVDCMISLATPPTMGWRARLMIRSSTSIHSQHRARRADRDQPHAGMISPTRPGPGPAHALAMPRRPPPTALRHFREIAAADVVDVACVDTHAAVHKVRRAGALCRAHMAGITVHTAAHRGPARPPYEQTILNLVPTTNII